MTPHGVAEKAARKFRLDLLANTLVTNRDYAANAIPMGVHDVGTKLENIHMLASSSIQDSVED